MSHYQTVFHVFEDPGHGWVKVKFELLESLGIAADITQFSYCDYENMNAFLEEDCDAALFIRAYLDRFGHNPTFRSHHTNRDSRIRSLPVYSFRNLSELTAVSNR